MGAMKSLGTLNACKNRLTEIPLELAASTSIMELFLSDNYLIEIPTKIMGMQSLKVFEAERKFHPFYDTFIFMINDMDVTVPFIRLLFAIFAMYNRTSIITHTCIQ